MGTAYRVVAGAARKMGASWHLIAVQELLDSDCEQWRVHGILVFGFVQDICHLVGGWSGSGEPGWRSQARM